MKLRGLFTWIGMPLKWYLQILGGDDVYLWFRGIYPKKYPKSKSFAETEV